MSNWWIAFSAEWTTCGAGWALVAAASAAMSARARQCFATRFHMQRAAQRLVHVLQDKRWGVGWYQDGIHPTAAGFKTLAAIIGDDLDRFDRLGGL